jgi:putative membrane protein
MGDWGPGWWIVMGLMMIVFWGLVVAGIVWLVRYLTPGSDRRETNATELLNRRLALGEVSVEEYEERRRALANNAAEPRSQAD